MADMVKVRSMTDATVSLYDATIPIRKVWDRRNATFPIERDKLVQLYYNSALEKLLRDGVLVIEDKAFLVEVGYLVDENDPINEIELTPALMKRCISVMPIAELKQTIMKMSRTQIIELATYAIENHNELKMDRIDVLSAASGKNILKAIELYKQAQED